MDLYGGGWDDDSEGQDGGVLMRFLDLSQVVSGLVTMLIGGAASWVVMHVRALVNDVTAAHCKIRDQDVRLKNLEDEVFDDKS